ncbi:MAG: type IX secretion system membrane protein PorP/SprF [Duncaniella sp.]|nr:type IX secretion system membrane protein PorP/SprF [Duncaniella sp.]MDE6582473.1 type IX secretion system membrane protein PorP/SprF [Duncaniella sp.]
MTRTRLLHIILPLLLVMLVRHYSTAQTDARLTQYWAVPTYYNPGAVGETDFVRLRGGSRLQWIGIDNAPTTFIVTGDMPVKIGKKRIGVGVMFQQETAGLYTNITADLQAGYKINLFKGVLTAAINVGLLNEKFKGSEVFIPDDDDYHQSTDEAIPMHDVGGNALDLGVGAYYYHPKFWAGISLLHANNPTVTFTSDSQTGTGGASGEGTSAKNFEFTAPRTLYFMAGSNIPIKNTLFEVIPSMLVRSDFTFTTFDVTARVRYNKFLSAGLAYRYNDAVSAMIGVDFKGFFLGYSFDYPTTEIAKASSGSHEIFAGYSLKLDFSEKNKNKHKSIRLM